MQRKYPQNISLEQAINKTLSPDEKIREEGRDELRTLSKNDPIASDFFTANSLETEYYQKEDTDAARKAIEKYEGLLNRGGFDFLKERIEQLKSDAGLCQ